MPSLKAAALTLAVILSGCTHRERVAETALTVPATVPLPPVLMLADYPLSTAQRPSTAADVWKQNLDARIAAYAARKDAASSTLLAMRAGALFQRYRAYGQLADLESAWSLAQSARQDLSHVDAQLSYAVLAAYLHEFEQASAALDRVAELDPRRPELPVLRVQIAEALGEITPATPTHEPLDAKERLRAGAQRCLQLGDLNCGSAHFHQLQFLEQDSSPMPLAWLHTQQGIALLRFGHPEAAIRFFRAALQRLPGYYVASEHLAECLGLIGQYDEADQLYRDVIAQTGHPEYMAGYAAMLLAAGKLAESERWSRRARAGYAGLLERFPAAYADHAVGFYLEQHDNAFAHRLALRNRELRADVNAELLLAHTYAANGECAEANNRLHAADATGWRPPERTEVAEAVQSCRRE